MKAQEFIADNTQTTMEHMVKNARKIPADKMTWQPMEEGRSTLDMVAECAVMCKGMPPILETMKLPDFTPEFMAAFQADKAKLDTLDKAVAALESATAIYVAAVRAVPDDKLAQKAPFFGPEPIPFSTVVDYHNWNMTYHTGQICYIQTLLGDKSM